MCGIAGIAGPKANRNLIEAMIRAIAHRGPDGDGVYQDNDLFLGHARLSIIDLITGDQPMANEDKTIWVVYNGEIYNFRELRNDLAIKGHVFRTASDTEVLLHGYEEYGLSFLQKLDGIFAFALWDANQKRLILARDYYGIKPLHYRFDGENLYFGSEIKAILQDPGVPREIDLQSLHYFLNLRYIPGEGTLFKGINRLLPAHFLIFEKGQIKTERFYSFKPVTDKKHDEDYYLEGIRHYLQEAIRKQMISDVPIGVYLSGGLDSSSIVAFMSKTTNHPINTFSMGFNEPTDELSDAKIIADLFGTAHHEISLNAEPLRSLPRVIWHAEEPKVNILQGYLLSQFAKESVKVVMGGLGGDELYAGYFNNQFIYPTSFFHEIIPPSVSKHFLNPISENIFSFQNKLGKPGLDEYRRGIQLMLAIGDPERFYLILRNVWDYDQGAFKKIYGSKIDTSGLKSTHCLFDSYFLSKQEKILDQVLWAEFNSKMIDDFLINEDRTSMANGVEVRVPFLDRELVNFSMGIPSNLKMKGNQTKYIFRKAMKGILPDEIIRKKKWGFSFNPYFQYQKDLKFVAERVLTKRRVEERGWLNYTYLRSILDNPPNPRLRWHYFFIWMAIGLEIWAKMFIENNNSSPEFDLEYYLTNE